MLNFNTKFLTKLPKTNFGFKLNIPKKGYKMQQLHFYTGSGAGTPSGLKACIFGATSSIGHRLAGFLTPNGIPTIFCHRNPLDVFMPVGMDTQFIRSNPYYTGNSFWINMIMFQM